MDWPDGKHRLHGPEAVRDYWRHQWTQTRTRDEMVAARELGSDRTVIRVRQVVRDLHGSVLSRGTSQHTFQFRDGLVARMDIRELALAEQEQCDA